MSLDDGSPVLLNGASDREGEGEGEGEFSFSQGLVPQRNAGAVTDKIYRTRENRLISDPLPDTLSSPLDRITSPSPSSSSMTDNANIVITDIVRGAAPSIPNSRSSGIDTNSYADRNENEEMDAAGSVSLRRRRGKHDRSTSSLSLSTSSRGEIGGERASESRAGRDRYGGSSAQAKGSKRSNRNGDTERRDSVIGKRKEREKEKEKGKEMLGSSLLSPVTPTGVAHWLMAAGSSALGYLERQLVDPDERGNLDRAHLANNGAEGAGMGGGSRGGSSVVLEAPGSQMRRGSDAETGTGTGLRNGHIGTGPEGMGMGMEGVGRIHVNLVSAFKSLVSDAAEGDHYVVSE